MKGSINSLVIGSGSCRGVAMVSALLKHLYLLPQIENYSGVSVGAVICLVLVVSKVPLAGLTKIFAMLKSLDFPFGFGFHPKCPSKTGFQLFSIDPLKKKLAAFLPENRTFRELFHSTGKFFNVRVTSVSGGVVDCNHRSTPDALVMKTVLASASMPLIFAPQKNLNECFVDGAVAASNRFPMLDKFDRERTLGVFVPTSGDQPPENACKYMLILSCPRVKFTTLNLTEDMVRYLQEVGNQARIVVV